MKKLTTRDRKLLIIALLAVVCYLAYAFVLGPIIEYGAELSEEKDTLQFRYEKSINAISQKAALEAELNEFKSIGAKLTERLIPSTNVKVAGAKLQQTLDGFLQKASLKTRSKKILKAEERGGFLAVPVELNATGTPSQLRDFLTRLMNDKMLLQIKKLDVRPENQRDPHSVIVEVVVVGYVITKAP